MQQLVLLHPEEGRRLKLSFSFLPFLWVSGLSGIRMLFLSELGSDAPLCLPALLWSPQILLPCPKCSPNGPWRESEAMQRWNNDLHGDVLISQICLWSSIIIFQTRAFPLKDFRSGAKTHASSDNRESIPEQLWHPKSSTTMEGFSYLLPQLDTQIAPLHFASTFTHSKNLKWDIMMTTVLGIYSSSPTYLHEHILHEQLNFRQMKFIKLIKSTDDLFLTLDK